VINVFVMVIADRLISAPALSMMDDELGTTESRTTCTYRTDRERARDNVSCHLFVSL